VSRRGRHTGQGADGVEVGRETLAEDEGGGDIRGRGVGDGVRLASLDTSSGELVDLEGEGSGDEGSARGDDLEETHVWVGVWGLLIRWVLS
jgi:hypothetical protein